jgi:hypothetical protein
VDAAPPKTGLPAADAALGGVAAPELAQQEEPERVADRRPHHEREEQRARRQKPGWDDVIFAAIAVVGIVWVGFLLYLGLQAVTFIFGSG